MANNFDSTLVAKILSQTAVTKVQEKLAMLAMFTTDFSNEVRDQRSRTVLVPFVSGGSAVQSNPTNFETGDTYVKNASIAMNHISKSFYITSADYGNGLRLESLAKYNMGVVTTAIEAAVFALLTEANYATQTAASLSAITAGGMTAANLKTLWGQVPGDNKIAILKDTEFANILPGDLYGYDITKNKSGFGYNYLDRSGSGFASAGSKLVAFGCDPAAIVMASAIPQYTTPVADLLNSTVVDVPGVGLSIQTNLWASSISRNTWASFDILFGAAVGDSSALKFIKTA